MIDLLQAAKARAFVQGRDFVLPDDIRMLAVATLALRIRLVSRANTDANTLIASLVG